MTSVFPPIPKRNRNVFEVIAPNLGLYLGRSRLEIADRAFADCMNVRIRNRKVTNINVGHELFFPDNLGGQVLLIALYTVSTGVSTSIFGTKTDLFRYDEGSGDPLYITPIYAAGTIATVSGGPIITGTGTLWSAAVKAGDMVAIGASDEDSIAATWYEVDSVDSNTQITLTTNYVGTTAGGKLYTIRQLFTASDLDWWDYDIFPDAPLGPESGLAAGDHIFLTNGKEVVVWDGDAARVVVISTETTGLGFSCKALCYFKNMMHYGNVTEGSTIRPSTVKNSAIGEPENVVTLEANDSIYAESVDFILALRRLGDYLVAYCDGSVNVAQFVASPFYFAIRTAAPDIGVYSGRTIVNFGDYHEFLSKDQAYRFDGVRLIPFGNQVFDEVLQQTDRERAEKALAARTDSEREVYWILPLTADNAASPSKSAEVAWVEHYAEQVGSSPVPFTKRYLPATAIGGYLSTSLNRWSGFTGVDFSELTQNFVSSFFSAAFPVTLFGDEHGNVYKLDTVTGFADDADAESFFESPTRPLADGSSRGIVRRVEPYFEMGASSEDIDIEVLTQERVGGVETSEQSGVALDHSSPRFRSHRNAGLYASVVFSSPLLPARGFRIEGYRVVSEILGER